MADVFEVVEELLWARPGSGWRLSGCFGPLFPVRFLLSTQSLNVRVQGEQQDQTLERSTQAVGNMPIQYEEGTGNNIIRRMQFSTMTG